MRLLLDTQILVWLVNGDARLRAAWLDAIADTSSQLFVSAVIAFEYTDLQRRGRLPVDERIDEILTRFEMRIDPLPADAWEIVLNLPDIHRDPVDRMLIAHAVCADMTLITADANIRRYPVTCV